MGRLYTASMRWLRDFCQQMRPVSLAQSRRHCNDPAALCHKTRHLGVCGNMEAVFSGIGVTYEMLVLAKREAPKSETQGSGLRTPST